MKHYLFFAYNITGIGGAQQYYKNRIRYLESNGFVVDLYSTISGDIQIEELSSHNKGIISEFNYLPISIRSKRRKKIIDNICATIKPNEEVLVESVGGYPTLWAELIAQTIEGKHVCFSVTEQHTVKYSPKVLEFYYFKYQRNELFGIKPDSVHIMFQGLHDIPVSEQLAFSAACTDVVDSTTKYDCSFPDADYTIGGIWRTNKEGFTITFLKIKEFIEKHPDLLFNVVIVGSGSNDNEQIVRNAYSEVKNANLLFLGYLYPIPENLLTNIDAFVSTAGSARVPMYCGKPTISVTTDNEGVFYPLGIFNYTTTNTLTPEKTDKTLDRYLEMILFEDYCSTHDVLDNSLLYPGDSEKYNKEQNEKFRSIDELSYFNVLDITPESGKDIINNILCRLIGAEGTQKITPMLHSIRERLKRG